MLTAFQYPWVCRPACVKLLLTTGTRSYFHSSLRRLCDELMVHDLRCSAGYGGGAFVDGTSATSVTLSNISQATFEGNQAATSPTQGGGGALYLSGGVTSLADSSFQGNAANNYGGGLAYTYQCFNFSSVPGQCVGIMIRHARAVCSDFQHQKVACMLVCNTPLVSCVAWREYAYFEQT